MNEIDRINKKLYLQKKKIERKMSAHTSLFRANGTIELVFFTTNTCHGVCPYCFVKKTKDGHPLREINSQEVDEFLQYVLENSSAEKMTCYWQGAEATELPLEVWRDLYTVIQKYKKRIKLTNILVSGLFTDINKVIDVLNAFKFDHLSYSIDPLRGERWHQVISKKIEHLRSLNVVNVVHSCIVVLSNSVYGREAEIVNTYKKYDIRRFRLRELVPVAGGEEYIVPNDKLIKMYKNFFDVYLNTELSFEPFEGFLYSWRFNEPHGTCAFYRGCGNLLSLRPGGEISSCDLSGELSPKLVLGTLKNLEETTKNIRAWRERRPEKCKTCKFEKVCNGGCPARAAVTSALEEVDNLCEVWYAIREYAYSVFDSLSYEDILKLWRKSNFSKMKYTKKLDIY